MLATLIIMYLHMHVDRKRPQNGLRIKINSILTVEHGDMYFTQETAVFQKEVLVQP